MMMTKNKLSSKDITLIATLAVILRISGTFALPALIPGTEFFLSAPIALAIAGVFGYRIYFYSSSISCLVGFIMGLTVLNCIVVLLFAWIVVGICRIFGNSLVVLGIAGPTASITSRLVQSVILGVPPLPLVLSVLPGVIFTVICYIPCYKILWRIVMGTHMGNYLVKNRPCWKKER